MDYSIKDVVNKINNEWFLPAIQRTYVWGSRYDEEKYICRLFDSLLNEYPIGLIILWKPDAPMEYRRFIDDFDENSIYKPKDKDDFKLGSDLVYDGQQRLQTLYSCLKFSFKGRKLVFNLKYERDVAEEGQDTGFRFLDEDESLGEFDIRVSVVFNMQNDIQKYDKRHEFQNKANTTEKDKRLIESNLDRLFDVFANQKHYSISVFEIKQKTDNEVNEIFQRLNMGGVQLSNADLLFSRIKEVYPKFESEIIEFTKQLAPSINAYDVLQLINLIVNGRTKIVPEFQKGEKGKKERHAFVQCWNDLKEPLKDTMVRYLGQHLSINRLQIIPRKAPLLDLIVYMYYLYKSGNNYVKQEKNSNWVKSIDKFFITAELNDWSLQSYSDNFARIFKEQSNKQDFPIQSLFDWVTNKGNRFVDISEKAFCDNRWFSLKIVMPNISYSFRDDMTKRFNPELDHIFPIHLDGKDADYRKTVDIVWNMQPVIGDINIDKSNFHPLDYFSGNIQGHKCGIEYFKYYCHVPPLDSPLWKDPQQFVESRKKQFIKFMETTYDIRIISSDEQDTAQTQDDQDKKSNPEVVFKKHRDNPKGDLAHFIEQCESSKKLKVNGLKED